MKEKERKDESSKHCWKTCIQQFNWRKKKKSWFGVEEDQEELKKNKYRSSNKNHKTFNIFVEILHFVFFELRSSSWVENHEWFSSSKLGERCKSCGQHNRTKVIDNKINRISVMITYECLLLFCAHTSSESCSSILVSVSFYNRSKFSIFFYLTSNRHTRWMKLKMRISLHDECQRGFDVSWSSSSWSSQN